MMFGTVIHVPLRMNFGDPLIFHLAPTLGKNVIFVKYLQN